MDLRLIEAGFPCHQVGAETNRERNTGQQPPTARLHVWWARRPLTPSRAAIVASLDPAGTDPETFVRQLGIERVQAQVAGEPWTLTGKLLERIESRAGLEVLPVDAVVLRALEKEQARREENRALIAELKAGAPELAADPVLRRWEAESRPLPMPWPEAGEALPVQRVMGDPAWFKDLMALATANDLRVPNLYGYDRAYAKTVGYEASDLTVLDPTAGGGSIPFEALRLGHKVIANELNPVSTAILYATLDYPARFGADLVEVVERWGRRLLSELDVGLRDAFQGEGPLPAVEAESLRNHLRGNSGIFEEFNRERVTTYLFVRQVTCPHCGGEAPLLNTCWLSKEARDPWGVRVVPEDGKVRFETYRVSGGRGPNGEDPNEVTVNRGVGQCVHCRQAIDGDEIKAQARGESPHGPWRDRLYCVVAVRLEPKLDGRGRPQRYTSGARKGEIKTPKVRFFRPPNDRDLAALAEAERRLEANWARWDAEGLIPTERFPEGNDMRPIIYGMTRWCDLFTPRQLLGHLTLIEGLRRLTPKILGELGEARGRAVVTYLQFAIDKGLDYNSRQTRWEFTRGVVKGTFGRHDFSLKWTFGEMIFTGPNSGAAWGLAQASKAYRELTELLEPVTEGTGGQPPVQVLNGTAAHMPQVGDRSVDLVCMDPPYYDNVQYAELSDYFYVWQRRTLRDLYPGLYDRRLTDKKTEAVANTARDGGAARAKAEYERMMGEIFAECRRVFKDEGLLTLMFTHKSQDAWETLTRSLIEAGWIITASFPVESEMTDAMHQKDMAAAASSIFISCRKRHTATAGPAVWQGFGGQGVRHEIERAVTEGLEAFAPLRLNPVDEMVASYGKALQVLSSHWPVQDGDEPVSPVRAMNEASRVVSQSRVSRITRGKLKVEDLDSETAMALTIFVIWECGEVAYDDLLNLSRSLGIALQGKAAGYHVRDREIGVNQSVGVRTRRADPALYFAPLVRKGSRLRLALPEERQGARLEAPQTDWDRLQGLVMAYRAGDIPVARAYLHQHAAGHEERILELLEVWAAESRDPDRRKEARVLLYGLGR